MREKVAALVTVLVTAVGLALPGHLFRSSRSLVEEHEIVDLRDEAVLRAWELVGRTGTLVEDVRVLSRDEGWLSTPDGFGDDWTTGLEEPLRGDPEDYPRVEIVGPEGEEIASAGEKPARAGSPENPEDHRAALLKLIRETGKPGEVFLSPIHYVHTGAKGRPVPVIWAGARTGAKPDERVVLVLLDIELTVGVNRTDPRHLYLLVRERADGPDGATELTFAVHPNPDLGIRGAPVGEEDVFPPDAGVVKALEESRPNVGDAQNAVRPIPRRLNRVPLAGEYRFVQGVPDGRLVGMLEVLAARTQDDRDLAERARKFTQDFRREVGDDTRVSLPGNAVSQVRALAGSEVAVGRILHEFPARVAEFLREVLAETPPGGLYKEGESATINWGKPTRCRSCDLWMVHLKLRGDGNEHAYRLAYAAFREELNYAITQEFGLLRVRAIMFGLLAGLLSFLAALWFVRPLDRITRAAGSAAESAALHGKMQEKINEVRESLPVARGDEVGDIARALERLLREVLNGHERLRQAKLDLDNQVAEQTQELRGKNTQLEQLAHEKDAFLGNVSHELRQPLNALFGFTQLLELSELDLEQRQDLGKIRKEAKHLLDLINDILDYQKIIMEGLDLECEPIELKTFLAEMGDSMGGAAKRSGNRLEVVVEDCPEEILNDSKRLRQVLVNLLGNACKFTSDGVITLRARQGLERGRKWVCFDVADTGRGMKPEEMTRLFTKFAKLSAKEGNPGGTGLGLVISKGLCELMGGDIMVKSEFGKGTTFTAKVPARVGEEPSGKAEAAAAAPAAAAPVHTGRTRPLVLVVDDDASVRELVCRFLGESEMDTITAGDGEAAFTLARDRLPDVITLDAVMPGMDGWDVLSKLKSDPATAGIPVVMVSFLEQRERGYALGAADYVVKPIDWPRLASVIERHLDGSRGSTILVVDDDPATREILRRTLEGEGWRVCEAENGREALEALAEHTPQLILLDLMMPVMDGFEFIEEYRRHEEWHRIPVVVVTARDPSAGEKRRLEGSVVRILQKGSYEQERLLEEIKTQVELQLHPPEPESPND